MTHHAQLKPKTTARKSRPAFSRGQESIHAHFAAAWPRRGISRPISHWRNASLRPEEPISAARVRDKLRLNQADQSVACTVEACRHSTAGPFNKPIASLRFLRRWQLFHSTCAASTDKPCSTTRIWLKVHENRGARRLRRLLIWLHWSTGARRRILVSGCAVTNTSHRLWGNAV